MHRGAWWAIACTHATIGYSTCQTPWHYYYRATHATHASAVVILFVCLSVSLSHVCFVTKPNDALRIFWYHTNGITSFLTPTVVGGRRPLPSEICAQSDPPPFEKRRLRQISAYNVSTVRDIEKVQLRQIGSRPRAFRWAIDGVRMFTTLPLNFRKGGSKSDFLFTSIKFNLNLASARKLLRVKTSNGKVVVLLFPYPTVHRFWRET